MSRLDRYPGVASIGFFLLKESAKGFGGGSVLSKPTAAIVGVPGYVMKWVHKEVQKLFWQQCAELHRRIPGGSRIRGVAAELQCSTARRH